MNQTTKKIIWIGVPLLVVLITLFLILGPKLGINMPSLSVVNSGFSTLALSQISLESNDPNLAGQVWLMTVSQNGAGQSAYGTTSTLSDAQGDTSNQFTLNLALNKNYATYPINNLGIAIKTISYTTTSYNPFGSLYGCNPQYWQFAYLPKPAIPYVTTVYCYSLSLAGYFGSIESGNYNFQSTISVQGTGGSDSCTISNINANSCYSQYGNVYASWVGNLVSGMSLPDPTSQGIGAVYDTSTGGWKTSSVAAFNNWNIMDNNNQQGLKSCIDQYGSGTTGGSACFNQYDGYESQIMAGTSFTTSGGITATTTGGQSNGQVILNLPTQFQFPVITMRIKAALIGVNIPVGKPQIISATSPTFQTGQTGNIMVTVKNIGTGPGTFSVGVSCNNGFQQSGNAQTISSLPVGQSQTTNIPLTSNVVSNTATGTCTITATDVNDAQNTATYTVSVSSSALTICTQGQEQFIGQNIQECQNNAWITIKTCNSTQHPDYVSGKIQCVDNSAVGGASSSGQCGLLGLGCAFSGIFSGISNFFQILKWSAVVLGAIIALIFTKELLSKTSIEQVISWILAIIVAGIIGLIIYKVIWVAVAVLVVYFLFKLFMPKI